MKTAIQYLFLVILLNLTQNLAIGQKSAVSMKDSAEMFTDDPIASMLDSLSRLTFFDKTTFKATKSKYNFPVDSIPNYTDSMYAKRLSKLDMESPFDLVYNSAVRNYIELYAVRKRAMVSRMLGMTQLYFPMIEEILDRKKIPLELKYLAIVESALNPTARSRAGAVGLWQFMYGTGKMMGLKITSYVDERSDPYKATEAACDYIQFLYDMFGDWQMVLAAYNGGPGTVSKAIRRSGGKNTYWEIRPYLPKETQGYVPAFIAVNYVMSHANEHNLYSVNPNLTFSDVDTVNIKEELSFNQIAKVLDMSVEEIQYLNPSYKRQTIPQQSKDNSYSLCLPTGKIGSFIANESEIYEYAKKDSLMQELAVKQIAQTHVVRKGEVISKIAQRYGCTPEDIKAWNYLRSVKLRTGQKITVYLPVKKSTGSTQASKTVVDTTRVAKINSVPKVSKETNEDASSMDGKYKLYTVQKGDSLWSIAQNNGVTIQQIKKWNGIPDGRKIMPGQKIKISIAG